MNENRNNISNKEGNKSSGKSWYGNESILKDVANLPFSYMTGAKMNLRTESLTSETSVPGIMKLEYTPGFGTCNSLGDATPLDTAGNNIYSFVRHMNSGGSNYDSADLLIYILGMDSCYAYWAFLKRLYGLLMSFKITNRYTPEAIVEAMGIDFDDVSDNPSRLRAYIKQYASKLATLVVPNTLPFLKRHIWLNENLFVDEDTDRAQYIFMQPHGYFKFEENTEVPEDKFGMLTYRKFLPDDGHLLNLTELKAFGNALISDSRWSEDHNIMSGDIMKAYQGNVIGVDLIPEDYVTTPKCDKDFLLEVANATVYNADGFVNTGITQDRATGRLNSNLTFTYGDHMSDFTKIRDVFTSKRILNVEDDNPTYASVIAATRLMSIPQSPTSPVLQVSNFGSEVVVRGVVYFYTYSNNTKTLESMPFGTVMYAGGSAQTLAQTLYTMGILSKFRYRPRIYPVVSGNSTPAAELVANYGDTYNVTLVSFDELEAINENIVLGELGIL